MTTPKSAGSRPKAAGHAKRPVPGRSDPIRTAARIEEAHRPPSQYAEPADQPPPLDEMAIDQAVANVVKNADDVLNQTVAQARIAAQQLREGNYNMRDVPVDVQIMGLRMIRLARELSETTLNVCEQLLRQFTKVGRPPVPGQPGKVPPFPSTKPTGYGYSPASQAAPPSSYGTPQTAPPPERTGLELTVEFDSQAKAIAHPAHLAKPRLPVTPDEISVTPLRHPTDKGDAIVDVAFTVDIGGSLIARIAIPPGQHPGVYSGMVVTHKQDVPLGILVIEVIK